MVRQQCSHHNLFGARLPQESVYFAGRLPYKPFERQLLLNRRLFYDDFFSLDSPPRHLGFQRSHCLWRSDQVCTPSPIFYKKSLTTLPRIADTSSEHVARAEMSTPVQPVVARAPIVDMPDNRRRSQLGHITRRLARIVSERDEPLPEAVVARELEPAVESRERRYPRRVYHDFYAREPEPEPVVPVAPVVESRERRYPRQVYHDLYVKREPATSIKETTKVTEKITVLDTPADLAAFNAANAGAKSPFATPSGSGATLSTITSTSQTTTVLASGSIPTPAPTADPSASGFSSGDAASSTASASASSSASDSASTSASATSTAASGEPTPAASGDPSDATPTSSATSSAASGQPTDAPADGASGEPKPTATSDGATPAEPSAGSSDPTTREDAGDITEARRGIYIKASTAPIVRRLATSGASWASSVRRQLNTH